MTRGRILSYKEKVLKSNIEYVGRRNSHIRQTKSWIQYSISEFNIVKLIYSTNHQRSDRIYWLKEDVNTSDIFKRALYLGSNITTDSQ